MDSRTVVPPSLAGPISLSPFRATLLQPALVSDPGATRLFSRPWRSVRGRVDTWERRRRLSHDSHPAVYLHEFTENGRTIRGLVGLIDVTRRAVGSADACVVPHEQIHPRQSDELADRMSQMHLQPAPILLVHRATTELRSFLGRLITTAPMRQYADHLGERHRIWAVREASDLDLINRQLSQTQAMIADGHHRYAAYLRLQARDPGGAWDSGPALLVDQLDTPLDVGAIHRVFPRLTMEDVQTAARALSVSFEFRPHAIAHVPRPDRVAITDGLRWAALELVPAPGRTVVEALHDRLIPALPRGPWQIDYHHTPESALEDLRHRSGVALILPPPGFDGILARAVDGATMPEKATSFHPKPPVGGLMRVVD